MPSLVITTSATITCVHQGALKIVPSQHQVLVGHQPVAIALDQISIVGCPGIPPSAIPSCTKATWSGVASRVLAGGQPVLVQAVPPAGPVPGQGVCIGSPPNTPLVYAVQLTVTAG
jgi:hypothetical protein